MILTITSFSKNGKGDGEMINFDKHYFIEKFLDDKFLSSIDFKKYTTLICDFNEDGIRDHCKKHFRSLEKMLLLYNNICDIAVKENPDIVIYQHPKKCSWIGDKDKTNRIVGNILNENDIFAIPKTYNIRSGKDLDKFNEYPLLMKVNKNFGRKKRELDSVVHSKQEAKDAYNKTFKKYVQKKNDVIALQLIDSFIPKLKCYHVIRFFVVNDILVDWSIRPSKQWSVHAKNTKVGKINDAENYIEPIIKNNMANIMDFIKRIHTITGNGFYCWDFIYSEKFNKFFICELGLKYFDIYMERRVNGKINKLSMDRIKMREFYVNLLKGTK